MAGLKGPSSSGEIGGHHDVGNSWAGHHGAAELRTKRSWHQVSAVLLQSGPAPAATGRILGYYQVLARS